VGDKKGSAAGRRRLGKGLSSLIGEAVAVPVSSGDDVSGDKLEEGGSGSGGDGGRLDRGGSGGGEGGGRGGPHPGRLPEGEGGGAYPGFVSEGGGGGSGLRLIRVDRIVPSPFQPRELMDEEALGQLAQSIRRSGMMQPVLVRRVGGAGWKPAPRGGSGGAGWKPAPRGGSGGAGWEPAPPSAGGGDGEDTGQESVPLGDTGQGYASVGGAGEELFELVAGERRWRAAQRAGLREIPALIKELSDVESAELALVENVQREDLNAVERGRGLRRMSEQFGLTHEEVADRVGLNRSSVTNLIRLTELDAEIVGMLLVGSLSMGHGRALLSMRPGELQLRVARKAASQGWSVRRLERHVRAVDPSFVAPPSSVDSGPEADAEVDRMIARNTHVADLERRLGDHLGTRVKIKTNEQGTKGRVVLEFYDLDHFDGLMGRMGFRGE